MPTGGAYRGRRVPSFGTPPGVLPNGGLLPVGSHCALAENLSSMLRSPDTSRHAVGFPIPRGVSLAEIQINQAHKNEPTSQYRIDKVIDDESINTQGEAHVTTTHCF